MTNDPRKTAEALLEIDSRYDRRTVVYRFDGKDIAFVDDLKGLARAYLEAVDLLNLVNDNWIDSVLTPAIDEFVARNGIFMESDEHN